MHLGASAFDDDYIPGRLVTLGVTYDCEQDQNPCTGQLFDRYIGNLNLNKVPIVEAGVGIGPCAPKKLANNRFEIACPLEVPPVSSSTVSVTFSTFPDGLNQDVRQDTTIIDEDGTHIGAFIMPPKAEISPDVKKRYFLYNSSSPGSKQITVSNEGPSSANRFVFFFFGNDNISFPHAQPPGVTYYHDEMITFDFKEINNPAEYIHPGGQKTFAINVQPDGAQKQIPYIYSFTGQINSLALPQPKKFKFYLVNTSNIPTGAAIAAGIIIGAVESKHSSENDSLAGSHQEKLLSNASDPTDTSLTVHVIMGSPSYSRDISYDLVPISTAQSPAGTTFLLSVSGSGVTISDLEFDKHTLNCTKTHSQALSCSLLADARITDIVLNALRTTVEFTDNTDSIETQVKVEKGGASFSFGSQRINISVENDGLPNGPYRSSCQDIKWDHNSAMLQAQCTNESKQQITSSIDYFNACWQGGDDYGELPPPGLTNNNGQLTCMVNNPAPGGSWVTNCKDPIYDGTTLTAFCMDADGGSYHKSSVRVRAACVANYKIPLPTGIPTISNQNGHLECDLQNFTSDMQSHCTFNSQWNGIDTLSAECNGVTSSFSGDQYKNTCIDGTPLTVQSDNKIGCEFSIQPDTPSSDNHEELQESVGLKLSNMLKLKPAS
ncbi:MAG: hypothetical protein ACR2PX_13515 [Endozoicomonas sp.]|uniref:hypothetical protein n=1 Tax=Endozoicomonas sp. TaxID=1892382 RepID=UPI003D9BBC62